MARFQAPAADRKFRGIESSMNEIVMYKTDWCPFCYRAEQLLRRKGVEHITYINVGGDLEQRLAMIQRSGRRTVPQIFIGETHIGGYDELAALERAGRLDAVLAGGAS
jgi:glutaredoxin 3